MAMTARGKRQPAPDPAELEIRLAKAEHLITLLLRIQNRDVKQRPGMPGASYRQIMVTEQQLASHEEVAELEAWLTDHHGG
jgi:hypothetical protein